ncbi:hypothetical protein BASA81_001847 [Batrachochytrium salamandrivorans]|nr:hypothetical protein BASA81_001847 [Batrachochytrium salamandrivorans]
MSSAPSQTRVYGFVTMLTARVVGVVYLLLALVPDRVAEEFLGNHVQSIRQASLSALVVLGVTIFYAYSSYALLVLTSIPSPDHKSWITDGFARPIATTTTTTTTTTAGGELGDISKLEWSRRLVRGQ